MTASMFPEPPLPRMNFSEHFSNPISINLMFKLGDKISWRKHEYKKFQPCEECQWFKHEHHGNASANREVRMRRTLVRGNITFAMDLCNVHASMWKQKDGVS